MAFLEDLDFIARAEAIKRETSFKRQRFELADKEIELRAIRIDIDNQS